MRIRDGKNSDPGWKKFGFEMEKIRIRDKHLGSATLVYHLNYGSYTCERIIKRLCMFAVQIKVPG
jgi:hypothetical protein